jgi:hypothetical protein
MLRHGDAQSWLRRGAAAAAALVVGGGGGGEGGRQAAGANFDDEARLQFKTISSQHNQKAA